ncbi:MAG: hypothetical protein WD029_03740, partial [Microthrixaceae bacterium]
MIRNLLLSGGPGHDFAQTSSALAKILSSQVKDKSTEHLQSLSRTGTTGVVTEIVADPGQFFDLLH